jgi:hypothetical protein
MTYSVSVIITHYNQSNLTQLSALSVLKAIEISHATYPDVKYEIIISDALSKNEHIKKLEDFIKDLDTKIEIKLLKPSQRLYALETRRSGLLASSGDYVLFLDGDDLLDSNFFVATFNCLVKHPDFEAIRNKRICFNDNSIWEEEYFIHRTSHNNFLSYDELVNHCEVSMTLFFKKDAAIKLYNLLPHNTIFFEDTLCYFVIVEILKLKVIEDSNSIYFYRRHKGSIVVNILFSKRSIKYFFISLNSYLINVKYAIENFSHNKRIMSYFIMEYNQTVKRNATLLGKILFFKKYKALKKLIKQAKAFV